MFFNSSLGSALGSMSGPSSLLTNLWSQVCNPTNYKNPIPLPTEILFLVFSFSLFLNFWISFFFLSLFSLKANTKPKSKSYFTLKTIHTQKVIKLRWFINFWTQIKESLKAKFKISMQPHYVMFKFFKKNFNYFQFSNFCWFLKVFLILLDFLKIFKKWTKLSNNLKKWTK